MYGREAQGQRACVSQWHSGFPTAQAGRMQELYAWFPTREAKRWYISQSCTKLYYVFEAQHNSHIFKYPLLIPIWNEQAKLIWLSKEPLFKSQLRIVYRMYVTISTTTNYQNVIYFKWLLIINSFDLSGPLLPISVWSQTWSQLV